MPEVFYSEVFFTLKGHYSESEDFYLDRSIILKILIPKGHFSEFRNNDPSE